jgi:hypothetical protein
MLLMICQLIIEKKKKKSNFLGLFLYSFTLLSIFVAQRKETSGCLSCLAKVAHFTAFVLIHTSLVSWKVLLG